MSLRATWLIRTVQRVASRRQQPQLQNQQRRWGGDMPRPQSMDAELFAGGKGDNGWKGPIYLTYLASAIILGVGFAVGPDTTIQSWAEAEARARLELKESKGFDKFEFGTHYNTTDVKFDFESLKPDNPFNEDDDDDDDDEEEDEDEEEEGEEDDDE